MVPIGSAARNQRNKTRSLHESGGAQRVEEIEHHGADLVDQRGGRCKQRGIALAKY